MAKAVNFLDQVHYYPLDQVQHIAIPRPSVAHSVDQVQRLELDQVQNTGT